MIEFPSNEVKVIYENWMLVKGIRKVWEFDENLRVQEFNIDKNYWKELEIQTCCMYRKGNFIFFVEHNVNSMPKIMRMNVYDKSCEWIKI